ncbi:ankyrin repeat-containing domain protein [Mycena rosella]|uniref:Ankyrin repeat-containing domain protein n=1 Tax=Mycena rosella TaxID=1033263 RepID=A0AAD7GJK2_MYCRO|nr:ankyrin repeat-containing domain protein [Mycena rosella]
MSTDYFAELPPELINLLPLSLSLRSLSALILTCRRIHDILQPELEASISPSFRRHLLRKAAAENPEIVAKLLSSPHGVDLDEGYDDRTPLYIAVNAGNKEIVALLLGAGANITARLGGSGPQALHLAVCNLDLEMMRLLLDHDAPIDETFGEYGDSNVTPLHHACAIGQLEMVQLLLHRGADIEYQSNLGSALGFAVQSGKPDVARLLLERGPNVTVHWRVQQDLLYVAMALRHPRRPSPTDRAEKEPAKWVGLPLGEPRKQLMALLLAYGASIDATMDLIRQNLTALTKGANQTRSEYLATVSGMLTEAEGAIPGRMLLQ